MAQSEKFINYLNNQPTALVNATNSTFGASGTNHTVGLVPDPGSTSNTYRILREDGTWASTLDDTTGVNNPLIIVTRHPNGLILTDATQVAQLKAVAESNNGDYNPITQLHDHVITFQGILGQDTGGLCIVPHSASNKGLRIDAVTGFVTPALWGAATFMAGFAKNVNFNSVADTAISLTIPGGGNWILEAVWVQNTGTTPSLTNAQFGLFSAVGGGGTALVAGGTALSALTSNTVNTLVSAINVATTNTGAWNYTTLYFRITTGQGAAASGNVYITIRSLP